MGRAWAQNIRTSERCKVSDRRLSGKFVSFVVDPQSEILYVGSSGYEALFRPVTALTIWQAMDCDEGVQVVSKV
jgi:hypothetical protein